MYELFCYNVFCTHNNLIMRWIISLLGDSSFITLHFSNLKKISRQRQWLLLKLFLSFPHEANLSFIFGILSSSICRYIPGEKLNEYSGASRRVYIQPLLVHKDVNEHRAISIRLLHFPSPMSPMCDRKKS